MPTRRRKSELSTEMLGFKVTKVERELIEARARRLGVNRSEAIRSALIDYLQYMEAIERMKNG
jgi:metal-responsive CopG/Arc/MetJ family transcriptional regulator